jgi:hypothetical protein
MYQARRKVMSTFNQSVVMAVLAVAVTAVYAQQAEIPARGTIPSSAFNQNDNGTLPKRKMS